MARGELRIYVGAAPGVGKTFAMLQGLGLAVAEDFADATGAEITIDDTPGGGATVALSLKVTP
jgi:K+-sensing histidine kinase KdpD